MGHRKDMSPWERERSQECGAEGRKQGEVSAQDRRAWLEAAFGVSVDLDTKDQR